MVFIIKKILVFSSFLGHLIDPVSICAIVLKLLLILFKYAHTHQHTFTVHYVICLFSLEIEYTHLHLSPRLIARKFYCISMEHQKCCDVKYQMWMNLIHWFFFHSVNFLRKLYQKSRSKIYFDRTFTIDVDVEDEKPSSRGWFIRYIKFRWAIVEKKRNRI